MVAGFDNQIFHSFQKIPKLVDRFLNLTNILTVIFSAKYDIQRTKPIKLSHKSNLCQQPIKRERKVKEMIQRKARKRFGFEIFFCPRFFNNSIILFFFFLFRQHGRIVTFFQQIFTCCTSSLVILLTLTIHIGKFSVFLIKVGIERRNSVIDRYNHFFPTVAKLPIISYMLHEHRKEQSQEMKDLIICIISNLTE